MWRPHIPHLRSGNIRSDGCYRHIAPTAQSYMFWGLYLRPYMMNDFLYRTHVILSLRKSYWHRNWLLFNEINEEVCIVVTRIFQQTFLKMNRFAFALHLAFIVSIFAGAGCTAPAHLIGTHQNPRKMRKCSKL